MESSEKKWNVPSAIAFVGALAAGAGMLIVAAIYKDAELFKVGVGALVIAGGIAAPQPMVGDR